MTYLLCPFMCAADTQSATNTTTNVMD